MSPKTWISVALFGLTSGMTTARADSLPKVKIYGSGVDSCGEWVEARRGPAGINMAMQAAWVLGWISAAGYYGPGLSKDRRPIREVDSDALLVWMDNYCQKHPLEFLSSGVIQLVEELATK